MLRHICPLCVLFAATAFAQEPPRVVDPARGWFFYDDPRREVEPTKRLNPNVAEEPPALSAQWFRDQFPKIQDRAIDDPTDANIELYLRVQQVMLDKADRFSTGVKRIQMLMPGLDQQQRTPSNKAAKSATREYAEAELETVMQRLKGEAGLIYYFASTCPYCAKQGPIMDALKRVHGLDVLYASLDGEPMPDGSTPSWVPDRGQAQQLGVRVTPALYLAHPASGRIVPLTQGLRTVDQIVDAIVEVGHAQGLISDAEYARITMTPEALLARATEIPPESAEPTQLLDYLRAIGEGQGANAATATTTLFPGVSR